MQASLNEACDRCFSRPANPVDTHTVRYACRILGRRVLKVAPLAVQHNRAFDYTVQADLSEAL
jgi:hypothetical protein